MRDMAPGWRNAGDAPDGGAPPSDVERMRALILVEIADFARIRRTIGIACGKLLALHVAERIAAVLTDAIVTPIGRTLIEVGLSVTGEAALDAAVAALHHSVEQPFALDGHRCQARLRIGAALVAKGGDEIALAEAAEEALAGAEAGLPSATQTIAASTAAGGDAAIVRELHHAIEHGELFLQYQPKLHLRRQEIVSIEALIRWRHPQRGLVLPGDFIPAAERCGAIKAVTLWSLRQAVADQRVLASHGRDLPVFVNIAGVLLSDDDFIAASAKLVSESAARLGFEITETSVIREPEIAIAHLRRLADIGVAITIDDYGAGLSSLAYLKQLPARELKIDKLFVTQLSSSHRDPLIVRSTIDLAHALEMEVVAEGVETPTSLALLSVMGCDMVQGFLISHPLSLEPLLTYLRGEGHRDLLEQSRSPLQRLTAVRARA